MALDLWLSIAACPLFCRMFGMIFAINSFNASVCGAYVFLQTKFLTVTRNARKFRPEALIRAVMTPKNFACSAIRRRKFAKKGG